MIYWEEMKRKSMVVGRSLEIYEKQKRESGLYRLYLVTENVKHIRLSCAENG
jgi:hypothetical protein